MARTLVEVSSEMLFWTEDRANYYRREVVRLEMATEVAKREARIFTHIASDLRKAMPIEESPTATRQETNAESVDGQREHRPTE